MQSKPFIINIYKPKDITSYDVIRKWKPILRKYGKVGHFGTLDPFAEGVLMLGVAGAQKLNDYIHDCFPKTYLAHGILGIETETGDLTVEASQRDLSEYLTENIAKFDKKFIEKSLKEKFIGVYWQAPHKYSAAKFEGKPLHEWARAGVDIKKEKTKREVLSIEVVKYEFPSLWIRYTVSSGTYVRTLFSDCANELGTIGVLENLIREKVGGCTIENALDLNPVENFTALEIEDVLKFPTIIFNEKESQLYSNGVKLKKERALSIEDISLKNLYWVKNNFNVTIGLATIVDGEIKSKINFTSLSS